MSTIESCRYAAVTTVSWSCSESSGIRVNIVLLSGGGGGGADSQAGSMKTMYVAYSRSAFNLLTEPCACPCKLQRCLITLSVFYLASAPENRETCLAENI